MHVDTLTGNRSGTLYNAIIYRRRRNVAAERSAVEASLCELSSEQKDRLMHYLKTCRLPGDKDALKATLSQHKDFRMDVIRNSFDEYKSVWDFYFVCPDLVSVRCFFSLKTFVSRKFIFCLCLTFIGSVRFHSDVPWNRRWFFDWLLAKYKRFRIDFRCNSG